MTDTLCVVGVTHNISLNLPFTIWYSEELVRGFFDFTSHSRCGRNAFPSLAKARGSRRSLRGVIDLSACVNAEVVVLHIGENNYEEISAVVSNNIHVFVI